VFDTIRSVQKGDNKAEGIRLVEEYYGIPHENTVAIGDTLPDLDMISYAGIGVAMGSGTDELKEKTEYITKSLEDDGVPYAMECIISGNAAKLRKE